MIIQAISTILQRIFQAVTASVGNLIAQEDKEKQYQIYHNIFFMNFWLYGFCTISLVALIDPFIQIWIGKNYILSPWATILIALNFFLYGMRQTNLMYINTYGLFWPIRIKPFVEGIINLSASLFFMLILDMGLYGVLLGTTVSVSYTHLDVYKRQGIRLF